MIKNLNKTIRTIFHFLTNILLVIISMYIFKLAHTYCQNYLFEQTILSSFKNKHDFAIQTFSPLLFFPFLLTLIIPFLYKIFFLKSNKQYISLPYIIVFSIYIIILLYEEVVTIIPEIWEYSIDIQDIQYNFTYYGFYFLALIITFYYHIDLMIIKKEN